MSILLREYSGICGALIAALGNARRSGRLAHAFLISSADADARRGFAVALAQLAVCPRSAETGEPDGECLHCLRLERGVYPAFYELSPVGKMYQIRVGERGNPEPNTIRSFIDRFGYTGDADAPLKIGVIHDADRMNAEAQNALLKTLEEPPRDTMLILETGNPGSLLPTIRSRCQPLVLPQNSVAYRFEGADRLFAALGECCFEADSLARAERAAQEIIAVAGGLAAAAEGKTDEAFRKETELAASLEDRAFQKRLEERVAAAASGEYMRERRAFLSAIGAFASQVFLLSRGVPPTELANPELFAGTRLPARIAPEEGDRILREAEELQRTLRFPVNEELALRSFAINLALPRMSRGSR